MISLTNTSSNPLIIADKSVPVGGCETFTEAEVEQFGANPAGAYHLENSLKVSEGFLEAEFEEVETETEEKDEKDLLLEEAAALGIEGLTRRNSVDSIKAAIEDAEDDEEDEEDAE